MAYLWKPITFLVIFLCVKEVAATTKPHSVNEQNGICKLMVDTQGYSCEEHTVRTKSP